MSAALVHAHEWDTPDTQRFVGLGVGRDTFFSYEYRKGHSVGFRHSGFDTEDIVRTFDYNAVNPNIVGYGLNSGAAYVRELGKGSADGVASNDPVNASTSVSNNALLLKQGSTRKCNAITFSSAGNIVATGYDRLRNAESLLLWDLNADTSVPLAKPGAHDTVLTTKFVPSEPNTLIFGGSRALKEYDVRSNTVMSSVPTNMCAKISFNPHCDLMFATYGESSSVALWDRRMLNAPQHEPLLVIPRVFKDTVKLESRCLRFSLEDGNEFAILQDGAMIRRWQLSVMHNTTRAAAQQSSQLTSSLSNSVGGFGNGAGASERPSLPFATTKNPALNALPRNMNCILHHHTSDIENWDLFINKVYDVHTETDKVVSFDYAPNLSTNQLDFVCLRLSGTMFRMPVPEPPLSIHLDPFNNFRMVLSPHRLIETAQEDRSQVKISNLCSINAQIMPDGSPVVYDSHHHSRHRTDSSPQNQQSQQNQQQQTQQTHQLGDLKINDSSSEGETSDSDTSEESVDIRRVSTEDTGLSDFTSDETGELDLKTILSNDITSLMQRRALAGYSLDAARNISLLSQNGANDSQNDAALASSGGTAANNNNNNNSNSTDSANEPSRPGHHHVRSRSRQLDTASLSASPPLSSGLLAAWKWVKKQQEIVSQSRNYLETPEVDLKYIGVLNVWDGLSEEALDPRLAPNAKMTNKTVDDAVKYAVRKSPGSVYVSADDNLTPYRQLCLRLSGWDFGLHELESRLVKLESQGQHEKAAGWAAFHNNIERAVESLAKSRKKNLRIMSTAVAGYLVYKDVPTNNVWREQCRRLASELSAPYLRAIFAFVADGSWLDVIDDGSLPLAERLGIALRFLPPKEVGKYLSLLTSRAILNGDLEGIILTGFTPKLLDLLQAYLDRTGDVQTVCLLVSFGWPRYFDDVRLPTWFAEYRQLLNSWRYFSQRARLDIARSKLVPSRYSRNVPPIMGQAFLRCSHCKQMITSSGHSNDKPSESARNSSKRTVALKTSKHIWNRCPSCNHPLPTCGVCTLPLGPCMDDETESDRWPMFCLKCNHGFHSVHARQWFDKYDVCPVPSCVCLCAKSTYT